jgi:hypothetical protein
LHVHRGISIPALERIAARRFDTPRELAELTEEAVRVER